MPFLGKKKRAQSMPANSVMVTNSIRRGVSVPGTRVEIIAVKSIMRVSSLDESLHKQGLSKSQSAKSLNWHEIQIREYARALGDNPSCSSGAPISIGWEYSPKIKRFPVEKYEDTKPPARTMKEMVLPRDVRFKMLTQEWDVPRQECASATREALKIKNSRRRTVHNLGKVNPKMEEAMENVGKKFQRSLSFGRRESDLQKLMQSAEIATAHLAAQASKEYEWEPKGVQNGESKESLADYDVCLEDEDHDSDPETEIPKVEAPKKKPIYISEDDATAC